jgi:3-hydroxyisobutyrate dehydrogenase
LGRVNMADGRQTLGWIGIGRMGHPMAERLIKKGHVVQIWNRTRAKAEDLVTANSSLVDKPSALGKVDVLFTMLATAKDLEEIYFGKEGVLAGGKPKIIVDCTSIGVDSSAALRKRLNEAGVEFIAAPVSGNGKCVKAGKLSIVASGPEHVFQQVLPYLEAIAGAGVSYVGEGELARICKVAHNVFLGVVIQSLAEITVLAQKTGVPRHAFLDFINKSVMGSTFTRYKAPALVNLDWTTTFTPELLRKDMDLGLSQARALDVPMPVAAATREAIQAHFGAAHFKPDPMTYINADFAALLETVAQAAGLTLAPENVPVKSGLEV